MEVIGDELANIDILGTYIMINITINIRSTD